MGYLEEAVHTYTRCLRELDAGSGPEWTKDDFNFPGVAVKYRNMQEDRRSMRDLILYITLNT